MFSEYLESHPLKELIRREGYHPFPSAENRAAWEAVPEGIRTEMAGIREAYRDTPWPMRKATDFLAFARSGSRTADEKPYFTRRRRLCAAVTACCAGEWDALDDAVDGIWCICEESSWVISAHNINAIPGAPSPKEFPLPDVKRPYVDLFAAQTAMILGYTLELLRPRLDGISPEIAKRIRNEIFRRVLIPFRKTDDFWWMGVRRKDLNNWTPWIVSNVMMAACSVNLSRGSLAAVLDRGCRMLDRWLDTVPADGGCDEGAGYWNMAGGALLDCLELLEEVTAGRMAFWTDEKLRNILTFPLKAELGGGWFINFADCDARPMLSGERLQYAGEKLGNPGLISLGLRMRGKLSDQLADVPHFSRLLRMIFHPAGEAPPAELPGDVWLPDLQVRMVRRGGLTLCCKGGHNGENHNHNDVGSFMLYADGTPVLADAGNMTYTAKTFSGERYTLWNTRSAYHNLPLIGEEEQLPGREHAARDVRCLKDGLSLDLAGAYGEKAGVESLQRELHLTEEGLTLRDRAVLREAKPVTWVFLFRNRSRRERTDLTDGIIRTRIPSGWELRTEEIPVTDPRMARCFPGSLWRVLCTAPAAREQQAELVFRKVTRA